MSTPVNSVAPSNNAFGGGTITPAANPVAVGGSFAGAGAGAAPPTVPTPAIMSARNNSGSNVRIPYARLVPMRGKANVPGTAALNWKAIPGLSGIGNDELAGRPLGNEYDGLESGELAWILGRRHVPSGGMAGMAAINGSAHGLGVGYGPDRMQRLAYTSWIEGFFRASFGTTVVQLHELYITRPDNVALSSTLQDYEPFLAGATVLSSVDVPYTVNGTFSRSNSNPDGTLKAPAQLKYSDGVKDGTKDAKPVERLGDTRDGLATGLFVMEEGPFLRGKVINDDVVKMADPLNSEVNSGDRIYHDVPRNLGDELAFDALYAHLKGRSFFDWTPDGMVLSKLESPSGDPMSSAEMDAHQAQLFNVAIQGPAIAKTWTGHPKQQTMPMDRVFVVMVADVHTEVVADKKVGAGDPTATKNSVDAYANFVKGKNQPRWAPTGAGRGDGKEPSKDGGTYHDAVVELFRATKAATTGEARDAETKREDVIKAQNVLAGFMSETQDIDMAAWRTDADLLRRGAKGVSESTMTNFRLMRCTSSFLTQYSAARFSKDGKRLDKDSRCGLKMGTKGAGSYTAEYIIGGWCVGTVLDNAASRSTVGHLVRIAPASMALNINVNVEWWSGDKLYKHYMDVSGTVQRRGEMAKPDNKADPFAGSEKRDIGLDVGLADLEEALPWDQANN